MKKIGIITHYYKSTNYGGNLQAYALCKYLINEGYEAEQICYPIFKPNVKIRVSNFSTFLQLIRSLISHFIFFPHHIYYKTSKSKTKKAFENFNLSIIPNSGKVYNDSNFNECIENYDVFITGSDQVWNFSFFRPEYFLESIPSTISKISYAASISMKSLSDNQQEYLAKVLQDYKSISVREEYAKDLISGIVQKPIYKVVDPVFLLSEAEWNDLAYDYRIKDDYIFSYFIGNNNNSREICRVFARKHGLKIIDIPMANNQYRFTGIQIGDIKATDVSPNEFLGLIKNAQFIFTDSFHASVFSYLFKKQFYVFNRNHNGDMSERIIDIMSQFGLLPYFCDDSSKESIEYVTSLPIIDYTKLNDEVVKTNIDNSKRYLEESLLK
ncbi:MAG: polysaccharide pyruvyl transferase family protein [Ruminococcus sp.]|nr:polysaccharide pyruvyl transferase family protein [Ruminococcus sp.]